MSISNCPPMVERGWPPPLFYELCDGASERLFYGLIVFCPWAFGTTTSWAMHIANSLSYCLGLLLLLKWMIRWQTGYAPPRWSGPLDRRAASLTRWLGVVTTVLLAQTFIGAVNARATYARATGTFDYHRCINWLPHSYDSVSTWQAFWCYAAWAAAFWALRDWLLGLSEREVLSRLTEADSLGPHPATISLPSFPDRLKRLLWCLSLNGAVLALEAIVQQTSGTNKLLWFQNTLHHRSAQAQFGPFAYRANGAQYINLIWPVTLGFWLALQRTRSRLLRTRCHLLWACIVIMIAAPAMTISRGGVLVTSANVLASSLLLGFFGARKASPLRRWGIALLLFVGLAGGLCAVWERLTPRMQALGEGFRGRERLSEVGHRMATDAPWFGTGPKTLEPLYQLYRGAVDEYWPGQLHNDWLETRITFGVAGLGLILCGLTLVVGRWRLGGGIPINWRFVSFVWLAMTGCLVHARWDFPFQIYSITLLFLLYCSVLLCVGRK